MTSNQMDMWKEPPFIGRGSYITKLKEVYSAKRIFGVYGMRSVGKSRLVDHYVKTLCVEDECEALGSGTPTREYLVHKPININLRHHGNKESWYTYLCTQFGREPEAEATESRRWQQHIKELIVSKAERLFLLVFDDAEDVVENPVTNIDLLSFITHIAKFCRNVKIFITGTTLVKFAQLGKVYFELELQPLPYTEASLLLDIAAPNVLFGLEKRSLVQLSEGIPLLLLMIGSELTDPNKPVSPSAMVDMLTNFRLEALSKEFYPPEKRAALVYRRFVERLSDIYQSQMAILGFIPGSFDTPEARQMLDHESDAVAKSETLVPIRRRHILKYDSTTGRFDIQGVLRECLKLYFTIQNLPEVRTRYYRTFSSVMQRICSQLGTAEYTRALAEFSREQPNLYKLLAEVYNSTQDNYRFFIEVATNCSTLIERFMAGIGDHFYAQCLKLANTYGQEVDRASVHIAIGSSATNGKGNFPAGEENYRRAVEILQPRGRSLQLATVYQRLGWSLHSQGKSYDSLWYLEKALDMATSSGKEYESLALQSLSSLGIVHTWIGNFKPAKAYLFEALRRRRAIFGDKNPQIGETLNNIGLLYDQMAEPEKALEYFQEGLAVKRKNKSPPWSIAFSLNNVANKYCTLGKFDDSLELLDESMNILNAMEVPHKGAISLTYNSYGKVYRALKQYERSDEMFSKAVDMRFDIMPNSIAYIWSVIQLAKVKAELRDYSKCMWLTREILSKKDIGLKSMPHNDFVLECLQMQRDLYKCTGQIEDFHQTQWKIQSELIRLGDEFIRKCKEEKVAEVTEKLKSLRMELETEV